MSNHATADQNTKPTTTPPPGGYTNFARLHGDTVRDLIEALQRIDPDTKVRYMAAMVSEGYSNKRYAIVS